MILSMTGFGRHTEQLGADKITVEIKSLNSKGLDLSLRLPQSLRAHELDLRKIIGESAVRGKVEAYLYIESETPKTPAQINEPIVREYLKQIAAIAAGDELQALSLALKMPEALSQEKQETNPDQLQHVNRVLAQALQALHDFRAQ